MTRSMKIGRLSHLVVNLSFVSYVIVCALISSDNAYVVHPKSLQTPSKWANNEEIEIFREYLRIPTVHPNVDYKPAVDFIKKQAASLNLPVSIYYPVDEENPVVLLSWEGSQPELPTIMLNSHMDVVPVYEEYWTHPPFAAEMDDNGDIFARGAQDMKHNAMWYLAAIRALKLRGIERLKRTIHIIFVPDEEVGGARGMDPFTKSDVFRAMNVGFVLDEGGAAIHDDGTLPAYYVERTLWRIEFTFHGQSGHASQLYDNTPGEKLNYVLGKLSEYREEEKRKLKELNYPYGNVTTINLTVVKGGIAPNIIPAEMSATFDMRVSVNTDFKTFEQKINRWCEEAGGNITIRTLNRGEKEKATPVDESDPFWLAFKNGITEAGLKVEPTILAPSSDMRFIRRLSIPAIGFAPMSNTVFKAHDHNEYINADIYLAGIGVYEKLISSLGNA